MLDLVWYSIFDSQNLNVRLSLIFDIRHSIWMLDSVWYSIFNIRFECWIEFDIRYSTFDLNVGFSLIFDIRHSIWMLDLVWYSTFDIQNLNVRLHSKFECWMLNIEHLTKFWLLHFSPKTPPNYHCCQFLYRQWFNLISSFIQWSFMKIISFAYLRILMKTLVMRENILEKLRDVHIKLPMSHLPCVLVYQT